MRNSSYGSDMILVEIETGKVTGKFPRPSFDTCARMTAAASR